MFVILGTLVYKKLVEKNKITNKGFLSGKDEADAFESKDYIKLHQSTLRKADILANIFERTIDGTLITNATWFEKNGVHPSIIIELIKEHWMWSLIAMIAIVSGLVTKIF